MSLQKKILTIDDEPELCSEITSYLTDLGYDADFANTGKEGLEKIEKTPPDLLILDIRMPEMNGLEVMQELIQRFPHLVVVILSGYLDGEITKKSIECGAAECITKPIRLEELVERVIEPLIGKPAR